MWLNKHFSTNRNQFLPAVSIESVWSHKWPPRPGTVHIIVTPEKRLVGFSGRHAVPVAEVGGSDHGEAGQAGTRLVIPQTFTTKYKELTKITEDKDIYAKYGTHTISRFPCIASICTAPPVLGIYTRQIHMVSSTTEILDQGHLHPKLEVPRLTCLGRE
jgi:hypothetical protein